MKERKKPEKFLLPHGRPSDDRSFAFSSRVLSKAAKIKALINYGIISCGRPGPTPVLGSSAPALPPAARVAPVPGGASTATALSMIGAPGGRAPQQSSELCERMKA